MSRPTKVVRRTRPSRRKLPPTTVNDGLFHATFHNSPAMQSVVRASDRVLVEVNDTFLNKLNLKREDVIGKQPQELNFWLDPEKLLRYREELETHGFVRSREVRLRSRDGGILTVLLSTHPVQLNGELHFVSAGVDISERKSAEAKLLENESLLRETEARFSAALHTSPILMTIARLPDGKFVEVNEAFMRLTGFTREEIIGRDSKDLGLWVDLEARADFFAQLMKHRVVRNIDSLIRDRRGALHTMQISGEMIEINHEPHLITFALDITQRKQAEAELRESERRFRESEARMSTIFRASPAAVSVGRLSDGKFVAVNEAFLRTTGFSEAEVLGRNSVELGLYAELEQRTSLFEQLKTAGFVREFEYTLRSKDGLLRAMILSAEIVEVDGAPHVVAVAADITERKRAQVELQETLAKERELSQLKSDFVSLVSHEFRTPLEIIMSSADNLQRYHERLPKDKREQLLRTINKSVKRMSNMMEEVLVLGRLENDRMAFTPAPFDLPVFCQRVCDEIESATAKRCPIRLQVRNRHQLVVSDENVLRHIFTNLLSNAVKYSAPGESVDFAVELNDEAILCRIVDRGCGIPAADQKRLFQAFHRGSNVRQIPGTGLGLLIVQRCVELHGGEIEFASTEGKGTTFTVRLPLTVNP